MGHKKNDHTVIYGFLSTICLKIRVAYGQIRPPASKKWPYGKNDPNTVSVQKKRGPYGFPGSYSTSGCRLVAESPRPELSDVLKLETSIRQEISFASVDFSQVAGAPRKVRGRGFSFMHSRKLRRRATIQSRKEEMVVFSLHAQKRKQTSLPFLNSRKRRRSDSLKPLAEKERASSAKAFSRID